VPSAFAISTTRSPLAANSIARSGWALVVPRFRLQCHDMTARTAAVAVRSASTVIAGAGASAAGGIAAPEPGTLAMLAAGLIGLAAYAGRKK